MVEGVEILGILVSRGYAMRAIRITRQQAYYKSTILHTAIITLSNVKDHQYDLLKRHQKGVPCTTLRDSSSTLTLR